MHVYIVGASGVIGRALVPSLVARGDRVTALVRSLERAESIAGPGVDLVEGDLLQIDDDRLAELLGGCDAATHLATALRAGSPGLNTTNTNTALRTGGTEKLLRAATRAGVRRYVQQSIAFAYVDVGEDWVLETTPLQRAPDGSVRLIEQMESLVRSYGDRGLEWYILRGGAFVGPGTFQDDTIARLRAGTERMAGDGSNLVSFVHAADYAAAVEVSLHAPASDAVLNITATPIRNRDYLAQLSAILGVPAPKPDMSLDLPRSYRCSSAAAEALIGWRPSRSIWPDGLELRGEA